MNRNRQHRVILIGFVLCWVVLLAGFSPKAYAQNYRGPFEGRVLDAETRQPIEGAVVFVRWVKRHMGSRATFYDAAEVLTDEKGEFYIPKKWSWNPWTNLVMDSRIIIFKGGYGHVSTHWQPIKEAA